MKKTLTLLLSLFAVSVLLSACMKNGNSAANGAADSAKMTADANKAIAKAFYENVINAHNPTAMTQYSATSFEDHNPDPGMNGKGIDNNIKNFQGWFASMPDVHMTIDNIAADGDYVWVAYHMTGTMKGDMGPMKATGKSCNVGGMDLIKLKDGKATDRWGYYDMMGMMQQLGMQMPAEPPAASKKM